MDQNVQRIIESLAHAKDAAVVLEHIQLAVNSPAEAGAHAEIMAADASLAKGIETLEALKEKALARTGGSDSSNSDR